jgi:hypothetical protein
MDGKVARSLSHSVAVFESAATPRPLPLTAGSMVSTRAPSTCPPPRHSLGWYFAGQGRPSWPSPSVGEGRGGGEGEALVPPIRTCPRQGGRTQRLEVYPCEPPPGGRDCTSSGQRRERGNRLRVPCHALGVKSPRRDDGRALHPMRGACYTHDAPSTWPVSLSSMHRCLWGGSRCVVTCVDEITARMPSFATSVAHDSPGLRTVDSRL